MLAYIFVSITLYLELSAPKIDKPVINVEDNRLIEYPENFAEYLSRGIRLKRRKFASATGP